MERLGFQGKCVYVCGKERRASNVKPIQLQQLLADYNTSILTQQQQH